MPDWVVVVIVAGGAALTALLVAWYLLRRQGGGSAGGGVSEGDLDDDFLALLAASHATSLVLGPDDEVVRATPSAYAMGVARHGQLVQPQLIDMVAQARRSGGSHEEQVVLTRGAVLGTGRMTLSVQVVALSRERVLLLIEDQTAELRLEAVRRDFVANVSHELKTPVGSMALLAETIDSAADDPEAVRHFASRISTEAQRLSGLVQDIIDLSRLQDSDVIRDSARVRVHDIVTEAIARCEVEARARDIAVVYAPKDELAVFGEASLLVTAVRNLLDNALRYSDGGTRVTIAPGTDRDGMASIQIIDQGIGIEPDALPRVFERFYRVDRARSRATGGTGLGLSIVKHVAADHGGEVTVWSQPGRGSTFSLRLPLAADDATDVSVEDSMKGSEETP